MPARILLVEADQVGSGPAGKSAGHIGGLQASDYEVRRHCGPALGNRLIAAATEARALVRALIVAHDIPSDLRDGYVTIGRDGRQSVDIGKDFGIASYPYLLGLAFAANRLGVDIHENTRISAITRQENGFAVSTDAATLHVSHILAAGGHQMAQDIALLAPLLGRTTELRVSTIITDPLPEDVLRALMPEAGDARYPFADTRVNVAYGSIDRHNRIVFGACGTAMAPPDPKEIAARLTQMFPSLPERYRQATGRAIGWKPLVQDQRLCFTRDRLPNVGAIDDARTLLYVHALGGQGIALGTLLGKAAAEKFWNAQIGKCTDHAVFDAFAAIRHAALPRKQPWRKMIAAIGIRLRELEAVILAARGLD
jgi:glycine/D-amino acid oxidase-like deaminating enzyme